jgi:single-strand DNA-binding protein
MVNKITLIGRIGKIPEKRQLNNGIVVNTTLATSESWKKSTGEKVENTEWHQLVFWNKIAEVAERFLKKGDQIYVEGKIKYESYEDKDGIKRYVTKIHVQNLVMLGSKKESEPEPQKESKPEPEPQQDDFPF